MSERRITIAPVSHEELTNLTQTRIQIEQMAPWMAVRDGDLHSQAWEEGAGEGKGLIGGTMSARC